MFQPFQSTLGLDECGAQTQGWKAELQLQFHLNGNFHNGYAQTTASSRHYGPLRIQKLLYPEGPGLCHAIIVHPPGGIAGGDELLIRARIASRASALLTTPGATRWYGSMGATASQRVFLNIEGECEWLPMETIVYDRAQVHSEIQIDCADQARMIGWDTLIFGRQSFGEDFSQGQFYQTISCRFNDRLLWQERTRVTGNDPLFNSPIGFQDQCAASTLWAIRAANESWTEEDLESLRASAPDTAWTILWPRLLVGRQIGDPLLLKARNAHAWALLRPMVLKRTAIEPRIWAT
jgi:urease accessory protein